MLDYQAIIKSDTATRLLNVFTFEYSNTIFLIFKTLTKVILLYQSGGLPLSNSIVFISAMVLLKGKKPKLFTFKNSVVAEAGFEPTTFGL